MAEWNWLSPRESPAHSSSPDYVALTDDTMHSQAAAAMHSYYAPPSAQARPPAYHYDATPSHHSPYPYRPTPPSSYDPYYAYEAHHVVPPLVSPPVTDDYHSNHPIKPKKRKRQSKVSKPPKPPKPSQQPQAHTTASAMQSEAAPVQSKQYELIVSNAPPQVRSRELHQALNAQKCHLTDFYIPNYADPSTIIVVVKGFVQWRILSKLNEIEIRQCMCPIKPKPLNTLAGGKQQDKQQQQQQEVTQSNNEHAHENQATDGVDLAAHLDELQSVILDSVSVANEDEDVQPQPQQQAHIKVEIEATAVLETTSEPVHNAEFVEQEEEALETAADETAADEIASFDETNESSETTSTSGCLNTCANDDGVVDDGVVVQYSVHPIAAPPTPSSTPDTSKGDVVVDQEDGMHPIADTTLSAVPALDIIGDYGYDDNYDTDIENIVLFEDSPTDLNTDVPPLMSLHVENEHEYDVPDVDVSHDQVTDDYFDNFDNHFDDNFASTTQPLPHAPLDIEPLPPNEPIDMEVMEPSEPVATTTAPSRPVKPATIAQRAAAKSTKTRKPSISARTRTRPCTETADVQTTSNTTTTSPTKRLRKNVADTRLRKRSQLPSTSTSTRLPQTKPPSSHSSGSSRTSKSSAHKTSSLNSNFIPKPKPKLQSKSTVKAKSSLMLRDPKAIARKYSAKAKTVTLDRGKRQTIAIERALKCPIAYDTRSMFTKKLIECSQLYHHGMSFIQFQAIVLRIEKYMRSHCQSTTTYKFSCGQLFRKYRELRNIHQLEAFVRDTFGGPKKVKPQTPLQRLLLTHTQMEENGYPMKGGTHLEEEFRDFIETPKRQLYRSSRSKIHDLLAIDCEMCQTTRGSELTRISMVDRDGNTVYDEFVKPSNAITDYLTQWSGITEQLLQNVTKTIDDVHAEIFAFMDSETVLCGHSLENDLRAMKVIHTTVVDTAVLFMNRMRFRNNKRNIGYAIGSAGGRKLSLKHLCNEYLNLAIQGTQDNSGNEVIGHSSVEDAEAAMQLLLLQLKWEEQRSRNLGIVATSKSEDEDEDDDDGGDGDEATLTAVASVTKSAKIIQMKTQPDTQRTLMMKREMARKKRQILMKDMCRNSSTNNHRKMLPQKRKRLRAENDDDDVEVDNKKAAERNALFNKYTHNRHQSIDALMSSKQRFNTHTDNKATPTKDVAIASKEEMLSSLFDDDSPFVATPATNEDTNTKNTKTNGSSRSNIIASSHGVEAAITLNPDSRVIEVEAVNDSFLAAPAPTRISSHKSRGVKRKMPHHFDDDEDVDSYSDGNDDCTLSQLVLSPQKKKMKICAQRIKSKKKPTPTVKKAVLLNLQPDTDSDSDDDDDDDSGSDSDCSSILSLKSRSPSPTPSLSCSPSLSNDEWSNSPPPPPPLGIHEDDSDKDGDVDGSRKHKKRKNHKRERHKTKKKRDKKQHHEKAEKTKKHRKTEKEKTHRSASKHKTKSKIKLKAKAKSDKDLRSVAKSIVLEWCHQCLNPVFKKQKITRKEYSLIAKKSVDKILDSQRIWTPDKIKHLQSKSKPKVHSLVKAYIKKQTHS